MSYPSIGFPDYSRLNPNGGRHLIDLTGPLSGVPTSPIFSTVGFSYLSAWTLNNGNTANFDVFASWYDTNNVASLLGTSKYTPNGDNNNAVNMQVMSEWCSFSHILYSGPGAETPLTYVYGSTVALNQAARGSLSSPFANASPTIAAGASTYVLPNGCSGGMVTIAVTNGANSSWFCPVDYYQASSATWMQLYLIDGAVYGVSSIVNVALPSAPIRLQPFNTDSVSRTFTVSVVPAQG